MDRKEYNKLLVKEIESVIEKNPDLRFHQILQNIGIIELDMVNDFDSRGRIEKFSSDKFHEESKKTYDRVISLKTKSS